MKKGKARTALSQWTVNEYEKINGYIERAKKTGEQFAFMDAWENILDLVGGGSVKLDDLTPVEFLKITEKYKTDLEKTTFSKVKRVLTVEGLTFEAFEIGKKFQINAKQMQTGERMVKVKGALSFAEILAIVLHERNEAKETRYSEEAINKKAVVLGNMNAAEALPILAEWSNEIGNVLNFNLKNATE